MKTTHQLAKELLALPDVPVHVEMWVPMADHETVAVMTEHDPTGTAIICQQRNVPAPVKTARRCGGCG